MKNLALFLFCLAFPVIGTAQFDFEKYPGLKYQSFLNWETGRSKAKTENTTTIPHFFQDGGKITVRLTSFEGHWYEKSSIRIFNGKKQLAAFSEDAPFFPIGMDSVRVGDVNGDGLKDIKLICSYMGNGLGASLVKVIYLIQKSNRQFLKVSFNDETDYEKDRRERDFDGDGKYEVITMGYQEYQNHNYKVFNIYDWVGNRLVNVNGKADYPIMVQLLYRENFKVTKKISRKKMKSFSQKLPENYDAK